MNFKQRIRLVLRLITSALLFVACGTMEDKPVFPEVQFHIEKPETEVNFKLDKPWESVSLGYINVIKTDTLWQLWYESFDEKSQKYFRIDYNGYFCYAYSYDGINWIKPNLEKIEYNGNTNNNNILVSNRGVKNNGIHGITVFVDSMATASERYKMVYAKWIDSLSVNRVYGMVSRDGINWGKERLIYKQYSDTQTVCFVQDGVYKLFVRYWDGGEHGIGFRQIGYAESREFNDSFSKMESVNIFNGEKSKNIHLYNNAARLFQDSMYIMFPSVYDPDNDKMHLKIAYSSINNPKQYSFYLYNELYKVENSVNYRVVLASPQLIKEGDKSFWIYYTAKHNGHNVNSFNPNSFAGTIQRTRVSIEKD